MRERKGKKGGRERRLTRNVDAEGREEEHGGGEELGRPARRVVTPERDERCRIPRLDAVQLLRRSSRTHSACNRPRPGDRHDEDLPPDRLGRVAEAGDVGNINLNRAAEVDASGGCT